MIKGIAYVNREFKYQIHATDRTDKQFGTIVVDTNIEDFNSRVTVFDTGVVVIKSPTRHLEFNLKDGLLKCE